MIDAHHHLWAPQTPSLDIGYVWLKDIGARRPYGDPTPIQRDYLLDELRGEPAPRELSGSVHVQADPRLPDPVAETAFVQRMSDEAGFPVMIVGYVDLAAGTAAEVIVGHMAFSNVRGVRQIVSHLPDRPELSFAAANLLDDLTWRSQFALLADHGLSFDLQLYPEQMMQAADFLSGQPHVPVVIDHLGSPYDSSDAGMALWTEGMTALASLPHVHVKLSGYAMFFGAELGTRARHVTAEILRLFGPERAMFGSNFPVDSLHLTYPEILDFVSGEVADARTAAVMAETAARFYRFPEQGFAAGPG